MKPIFKIDKKFKGKKTSWMRKRWNPTDSPIEMNKTMKKIIDWLLYEHTGGYCIGVLVGMLTTALAIWLAVIQGLIIFSFV